MNDITNMTRLLNLREKLSQVGNFSFSYYQLNKRYPIEGLTDTQAEALCVYYEDLIEKIKKELA